MMYELLKWEPISRVSSETRDEKLCLCVNGEEVSCAAFAAAEESIYGDLPWPICAYYGACRVINSEGFTYGCKRCTIYKAAEKPPFWDENRAIAIANETVKKMEIGNENTN